MEAPAQRFEDSLIDSLHSSASSVTDRHSVIFFPQGGNQNTPNGVKVIEINVHGDQWRDPSTVKLITILRILYTPLILRRKPYFMT